MTPYTKFLIAANQLTDAQLSSLQRGIFGINKYLSGEFMGEPGKVKLLVEADVNFMELTCNAMAYLSLFCSSADRVFPVLYRVHDFSKVRGAETGAVINIKPFRSFLSWSASDKISVEGVDNMDKEGLLCIDGRKAKVIFSYKVIREFTRPADSTAKSERLRDLIRTVDTMLSKAIDYESEKEVVVYHAKPFSARVLRIVSSKTQALDEVTKLGLLPYLQSPKKHNDGLKFTVKNHVAVSTMLDTRAAKCNRPMNWLSKSCRFQLQKQGANYLLVVFNLKR